MVDYSSQLLGEQLKMADPSTQVAMMSKLAELGINPAMMSGGGMGMGYNPMMMGMMGMGQQAPANPQPQYNNFTNPIISNNPQTGWLALNDSMNRFGSTLANTAMTQNMYRNMFGQGQQGQQTQPAQPQQQGQAPSAGQSGGQGLPMSPFAAGMPQGNSDMVQEEVSQGPFGQSWPRKFTNVDAKAKIKGAETMAGKQAEQMAGAQEGTTRDIQQLGMIKNALQPVVQSYNDVFNSNIGPFKGAGDIYGSGIVKNANKIPQLGGMQSKVVPDEVQNAAGKFLSNKNELITKMQPLLSQQFGKEGSSRIMESLLKMSGAEIGDLDTPKPQFEGQVEGTLRSMYRIAKASKTYQEDLANSGQKPNPETAAQDIFNRMNLQTLSPEEEKGVQDMVGQVLGKKQTASGGNMSPVVNKDGGRPKITQQKSAKTYVRQGTLPDGRRVGVGADGSVEIISK